MLWMGRWGQETNYLQTTDLNLSTKLTFLQATSDDFVSQIYLKVERPGTIPKKDFEDFAWTINDENPQDR